MTRNAIFFALCAIIFASCAITRPPVIEYRDSVRTEIRERLIHDTVNFPVPVEVEKIVTSDTASHLENSLASSDAVVSGGMLHHSLQTKPQTIPIPVTVPVTDTVYVEKETVTPPPEIVEVERELSWWQRFRISAFYWLLALSIVGWRREILTILKRILKR